MIPFLLRRAAWFLLTLWIVVSVSFVLMRAVRGGPFSSERALSPAIEARLAEMKLGSGGSSGAITSGGSSGALGSGSSSGGSSSSSGCPWAST